MSQTFKCPNCGAPLKYDGGPDLTMECPYCKSPVIVPEELRGGAWGGAPPIAGTLDEVIQMAGPLAEIARLVRSGRKIEAVNLYRQTFNVGLQEAKVAVDKMERGEPVTMTSVTVERIAPGEPVVMTDVAVEPPDSGRIPATPIPSVQKNTGRAGWVWLLVIGVSLALGFLVFFLILLLQSRQSVFAPPAVSPTPPPPTPEYASAVLRFGGEGIGPGWFQDARSIAVDGAGHIYVAEYEGGHVQVFDPTGAFITQWSVGDAGRYIYDMTADRRGTVYVVAYGTILRVEGATGRLLGELASPDDHYWFDQVARMPDGGLLAMYEHDNLVRFDAEGRVVQVLHEVISSVTGESEPMRDLAVDGLGNIFIVGVFDPTIFKFTSEGRFVDRFGGEGDAPGQFRGSVDAIAVDHQGRIYAADSDGIKVFDTTGGYLDTIEVIGGSVRAMAFTDQNELFVVTAAQKVIKFRLNRP